MINMQKEQDDAYRTIAKKIPPRIRRKYSKYKNIFVGPRPNGLFTDHMDEYLLIYDIMDKKAEEINLNERCAGSVFRFIMEMRDIVKQDPRFDHYKYRLCTPRLFRKRLSFYLYKFHLNPFLDHEGTVS